MLERLRLRLIGSVLAWDVVATVLCLALVVHPEPVVSRFQWLLYVGVALIWSLVFIILAPQRALFTRTLLEAFTRLFLAVFLATTSLAGLLYLMNGVVLERDAFARFVI